MSYRLLEWTFQGFCSHGFSWFTVTAQSPNSPYQTSALHRCTCPHNRPQNIKTTEHPIPLHHFTSGFMTSHQIAHDSTAHHMAAQHLTSHHITSHHVTHHVTIHDAISHDITSCHITSHVILQPTALLQLASAHNQPHYFIHVATNHMASYITSTPQKNNQPPTNNATIRRNGWCRQKNRFFGSTTGLSGHYWSLILESPDVDCRFMKFILWLCFFLSSVSF